MGGRTITAGLLAGMALTAATASAADAPSTTATLLPAPPVIDGDVTEVEWAGAAVVDGHFIQIEPEFGQPSPFRTVVRIGQTNAALYVAFESYDPDPDRLAAAVTRRDGDLGDDDAVGVVLDTFLDGRTAYGFATNPLATQWDARIADNGRTTDEVWDEAWACASRRHGDRWTTEFEIPFAILRFEPGEDRTWGLSLMRTVPRRLEVSLWSGPAEDPFRVSRFGTLTGLKLGSREEKSWQLIPYGLAAAEEGEKTDLEIGGDARWRPSSAVAVDATANPDFALIEADVEVINLTRFELFIPEKRPFFLEGSEMYQQRIRQFYSRRIGDITWGTKAIGTVGRTDFSAIVASESQPIEGFDDTIRAHYGIGRLQRTLPGGSTVGLLGGNRRRGGIDQGSVGVDTTLFFTETLGFTGQLLSVHGPTAKGGLAWFVRPSYDSARTHFHVRYTNLDPGISEDFNAVGFLRDDDRREFDTNLTRNFWIENGPVEKVEAGANYNRFYSHDGTLRAWALDAEVEVTFRNGFEVEIGRIDDYQLFEKGFRNDRTALEVGWDGRDGRSIRAFAARGVNFDSDLRLYGASADWAFGDAWRLGYSLTRLELDPDPAGDTTWIHVLEGLYAFTPDLFVKLFTQTNSAIDKVNVQLVGVWRFKPPFGSLQLAYQRGTSEAGEVSTQGDTVFTKLSWVF
ncbi:MAG: carbohydrate binding family 9 domain-containing protein [Acidobacteria bacterium]|nr:carbohydrate binding family 9 domain-containing protein [Acidobacteriota bacterium]